MYKIANQVIDAYDDIHWNYLEKIAKERPETNVMTPDELAKVADEDFAVCFLTKEAQKLRKLPVDCHDNVWLSNRYYEETHHKMAADAARTAAYFIKKACERFNIEPSASVVKLAADASPENNLVFHLDTVSPVESVREINLQKFAEVEKIADNYVHAQYVFATPAHVKVACEYFDKKHDKMPLEVRHKYAAAIQLRARELGMPAQTGTVAKYAADSYGADLDAHLSSRRRLLEGSPNYDELAKLASTRKQYTPSQFAQILHGFDKKAGLTQYYGGYITNPYESTFSNQPDVDQGYRWMDKKGSARLTEEEIRRVVKDHNPKIAEYFGKQTAMEMMKDPISIFQSLPDDAKEIFVHFNDGLL